MLRGVAFVVRKPAAWRWAIVPAVLAALIFSAMGLGAVNIAFRLARHALSSPEATAWTDVATWLLGLALAAAGLLVSLLVALALAQPLSGFALEEIARLQGLDLGSPPPPAIAPSRAFFRALAVGLTALAISLPLVAGLTLVTLFVPPASCVTLPLKFFVTSLALAYDLLDYPLSLQGVSVRHRLAFMREHFMAVLGFGLTAAVLLFVPGLSLLLLPFAVAGATRLVVTASSQAAPFSASTTAPSRP
jgi:CysZ protein